MIRAHEIAHVKFLKKSLGKAVVERPKFNFSDTVTDPNKFLQTAYVLENTGVASYLGQAGRIKHTAVLGAAGSILTVEARHAGAIGQLIGKDVSPDGSFDEGKSMSAILAAVGKTGFIV